MINRYQIISLIEASFKTKRTDYAIKLARSWVHASPNDFSINLLLSKALFKTKQIDEAYNILARLSVIDPENILVYKLLTKVCKELGDSENMKLSEGILNVLQGNSLPRIPWLVSTRESFTAINNKQWELARESSERALQANPISALPALLLIKSHWLSGNPDLAFPLAQGFHARWPECIAINLCLAEALLQTGDYTKGVEILHELVSLDPAREVVDRYWQSDHSYRPIWPPDPSVNHPGPIPTDIAAILGINQLEDTNKQHNNYSSHQVITNAIPQDTPLHYAMIKNANKNIYSETHDLYESTDYQIDNNKIINDSDNTTVLSTTDNNISTANIANQNNHQKNKPNKLAININDKSHIETNEFHESIEASLSTPQIVNNVKTNNKLSTHKRSLGSTPVHIIITCVRPLVQQFGTKGAEKILTLTRLLSETRSQTLRIQSEVILPDVPENMATFDIPTISNNDSSSITNVIKSISTYLEKLNKHIESILIIGGDEIIPFHRLPNPTDDHDSDVPTDNPYGTDDNNYFVPKWPVGRLPSHADSNSEFLETIILNAINAHKKPVIKMPFFYDWLKWIFPSWQPGKSQQNNLGYSADIWLDASLEVFRDIGNRKKLISSPPIESHTFPIERLKNTSDLFYCNLHGLENTAEWFGESTSFANQTSQYPVALKPSDITNNSHTPNVVFTEACYGANILNKQSADEALCLHFMNLGSIAVVGSTRIAYGALGTPLIGADLIGKFFYSHLNKGIPIGETLRRSKIGLAQTMNSRQGFLDGEDQKALLSFVLFGDPLLKGPKMIPNNSLGLPKSIQIQASHVHNIQAACAKSHNACTKAMDNPEALEQVRAMVSHYLPGMENSDYSVRKPHIGCDGNDHSCIAQHAHSKTITTDLDQLIYSTKRVINCNNHQNKQYAHATVHNKSGKIIKLAVSR